MEKTIVIDGKQVRLKSTAATVKRYKAQFRRDLFADMMALGAIGTFTPQDGSQPSIDLSNVDLKKIDFEVIYDLVWLYAKIADPNLPDPITWLDGFEEFPIYEIIPEINDMIQSTMGAKKKLKKSNEEQGTFSDEEFTTDLFLALCYKSKLTSWDLEVMTIGDCFDYIAEFAEMENPDKEKTRKANQKDFDSF